MPVRTKAVRSAVTAGVVSIVSVLGALHRAGVIDARAALPLAADEAEQLAAILGDAFGSLDHVVASDIAALLRNRFDIPSGNTPS